MKPLRIFRHIACEGPGYLGTYLQQQQVPYQVICIDEGSAVPTQLDDISGLVFMGGAMSVNDPRPWINEELSLIGHALAEDIPVLGICFGAQLMCKALDGEVSKGPSMEIGWHPVSKDTQNDCNWLRDLPASFTPFHWHADGFTVPETACRLYGSDCFTNQAFTIGNSLAMQFHLEMTDAMIRQWIQLYGSDLRSGHACAQSQQAILQAMPKWLPELHKVADCLYTSWLQRLPRG